MDRKIAMAKIMSTWIIGVPEVPKGTAARAYKALSRDLPLRNRQRILFALA